MYCDVLINEWHASTTHTHTHTYIYIYMGNLGVLSAVPPPPLASSCQELWMSWTVSFQDYNMSWYNVECAMIIRKTAWINFNPQVPNQQPLYKLMCSPGKLQELNWSSTNFNWSSTELSPTMAQSLHLQQSLQTSVDIGDSVGSHPPQGSILRGLFEVPQLAYILYIFMHF